MLHSVLFGLQLAGSLSDHRAEGANTPGTSRRADFYSGWQLQQRLDAAIAAAAPTFALPGGDVAFSRGERLIVRAATNMQIVSSATRTTLWFQPGGGLRIVESANVTISGVTIDYDPLPYIQAEIVAMQELGPFHTKTADVLPPAKLTSCEKPTPKEQFWSLGVPFAGFISNAGSGSVTAPQYCLNIDDCNTGLIYDGCPRTEAKSRVTCAGKGNYSIFEFRLEKARGNSSQQQLRSVYGNNDCIAVTLDDKCAGCTGDPCTRDNKPCFGCSASSGCRTTSTSTATLKRVPCNPRDDSQLWSHTAAGQLRSGGLCLTAAKAPAPAPPPSQTQIRYTLRLADRSPLFNNSCAKPDYNQSTPWDNNASVCEHYGINQLFGKDRSAKIGSDFGDCPPLPTSMCPMPQVPSVSTFETVGNRTFAAVMPPMLDKNGEVVVVWCSE